LKKVLSGRRLSKKVNSGNGKYIRKTQIYFGP